MPKKNVNVSAYYRSTTCVARATADLKNVIEVLLAAAWRRDYSGPDPQAAVRAAAALAELDEALRVWGKRLVEERGGFELSAPTRANRPPQPWPG